jgi:hypothetical protein
VARSAVLTIIVMTALALVASVGFVVGGADAARLAAGGALLFGIGVAASSLVNRAERRRRQRRRRQRRRRQAGLRALIELENVGAGDDLPVMLAQYGRARIGFRRVVVLTRTGDRWRGATSTEAGEVSATGTAATSSSCSFRTAAASTRCASPNACARRLRAMSRFLVTVCAGVGEMPGNAGDAERLVAAADAALYAAKRDGRNRSVGSDRVAEPGEVPRHPSALRRPVEPDAISAEGVVA